ncbi:MAG: radical SAM family heme chaperone HemW [Phaeodactylibacter sp.]|nr:radical SAM family heme chaperone HemW [Phaeodactylibacter sp.]MCB9053915.1 radical SAM family heme chaperone HemW [Lewinellaceae bacterium]
MPGIYLHIPFCKQACHYCNFHFSTSLKYKEEMVGAMLRELALRHGYLADKELDSIYFGGGTPSLLTEGELMRFFEEIGKYFTLRPGAEVTLEANPDDLAKEKIAALRRTPVNRLSIGIQSFFEEDLQFFNRAHNAREARACLEDALSAGFNDLTIDLIYGSPTTTDAHWEENLNIIFGYPIPHVSCYALTVEERTALAHFIKAGKSRPVDEEHAARQFEMLVSAMRAQGYVQYEISNFARPGHFAVHNSSYWKGEPYLGLGPSAHSYNGESRQWNIANNAKYMRALSDLSDLQDPPPGLFEIERLSPADRYNEYVMTGLRTIWGVELGRLRQMGAAFEPHFRQHIRPFLENGQAEQAGDTFRLTDAGRFLADGIAAAVFWA